MTPVVESARRSRRRDWLLLPLIALLTLAAMVAGVELLARLLFPVSETSAISCLVVNDETTGVRAKPNSVCHEKIYESALTEYRYNARGHRNDYDYGPKAPGTYRIVLVGSSFSEGLWVPREKTFAALLPGELSHETGRSVELYNEGMQWGTPRSVDLRFGEVLAAKPDLVLWTVTPWDIENSSLLIPYVAPKFAAQPPPPRDPAVLQKIKTVRPTVASISFAAEFAWLRTLKLFSETYTSLMLQHFLYESRSQYLKHYLMNGEGNDFLHAQPNAYLLGNLDEFDKYAKEITAKAKAAGVPVVVVLLPQRAQAAMISMGHWPAGFDPYRFGEEIRQRVEGDGGYYVDVLRDFRTVPDPEQHYLPVDGHIDATAHAMIAGMLARELAQGTVPGLGARAVQAAGPGAAGQALGPAGSGQAAGRVP